MEKYKELVKEIICNKYIDESDFVSINDINFKEKGIIVNYEYYLYSNSNKTKFDNIEIYNSELNAYIFESLKN